MIELQDISLRQGSFALSGVNLTIPTGDYAVLMGRSGCGKTTLLEVVCGLRAVQSGQVRLNRRDVTSLPPAARGVGYVPQDRALFPTKRVRDQLAFALTIRKTPPDIIAERVSELATLLDIQDLLDRKPQGLSGGEAQRVALGRALANSPEVMCLDEPLSALDEALHEEISALLSKIHQTTGITVLHITHSQTEARRLGTHIFRLENGTITPVPTTP